MLWLALMAMQDEVVLSTGDKKTGSIVYDGAKVRIGGAVIAWADVASIRDAVDPAEPPDGAAAEFARRREKADSAKELCELGLWALSRRLGEPAKAAFEAALKLDPDHAEARAALGFAKTDAGWRPSSEVYAERRAAVADDDLRKLVDLSIWCSKNGLPAEQEQLLLDVVSRDGHHKGAIQLLRPLMASHAQAASLRSPLAGRIWAARDTTKHHHNNVWSQYAIDFFRMGDDGLPYKNRGKENADYYGWDQPVYAAGDGEVTSAQGDFEDMIPGKPGAFDAANSVSIRHASGEVTDYGHLRKGSVTVKVGDAVKKGQVIGRVGNSGASGSPHLHFTLLVKRRATDTKPMWIGVPFAFEDLTLVRIDTTGVKADVKRAVIQEGWTFEAPKPD